jgi:hypothetical protein
VVLPVNMLGNYVPTDSTSATSDLDRYTIGHVAPGSRLLWVHAASVVWKTLAVLALLWRFSGWVHAQQLRARRAAHAAAAPAQRTVLVTHVPPGADVETSFRAWYGDAVERVTPVVDPASLASIVSEKAALTAELASARRALSASGVGISGGGARPRRRVPAWRPWGESVDTLDYCAERLLVCDARLAAARRGVLSHPPEAALLRRAAFVTFASPRAASVAGQVVHGVDMGAWRCSPAPEPGNVCWANIGRYTSSEALALQLASWAATIAFCALYLVPAAAIQSFTFAASLARAFPPLRKALANAATQSLVEGVLPGVLLFLLAWIWPLFLRAFTVAQGAVTNSDIDRGMTSKSFLFNVLIAFISTVLSGAVMAGLIEVVNKPATIPRLLAVKIPATSRFFMTYAILQGVGGGGAMLARWWPALQYLARQRGAAAARRGALRGSRDGPACAAAAAASSDAAQAADDEASLWPPFHQPFGRFFPRILLQIQILVIFSTIAPLMQAVSLCFFLPAISAAKVKMLFHHEKDYEGFGRMWPLVRSCVCIILLVYQVTMSGLLGLKGGLYPAWVSGTICIPATLLAGRRMAARFNPSMYGAFPIEMHAELERKAARRSANAHHGGGAGGGGVARVSDSSASGRGNGSGHAAAAVEMVEPPLPFWPGAHLAVRLPACARRGTGGSDLGGLDAMPESPPQQQQQEQQDWPSLPASPAPAVPPAPASHPPPAAARALPYLHPDLDVDESLADDAALTRRFGRSGLADVVLRGFAAAGFAAAGARARTGFVGRCVTGLTRRLRALGALYCTLLVDPVDLRSEDDDAAEAEDVEEEGPPPTPRIPQWAGSPGQLL